MAKHYDKQYKKASVLFIAVRLPVLKNIPSYSVWCPIGALFFLQKWFLMVSSGNLQWNFPSKFHHPKNGLKPGNPHKYLVFRTKKGTIFRWFLRGDNQIWTDLLLKKPRRKELSATCSQYLHTFCIHLYFSLYLKTRLSPAKQSRGCEAASIYPWRLELCQPENQPSYRWLIERFSSINRLITLYIISEIT